MDTGIVKLAGLNFNKSAIFKDDCGRTLASHACLYLVEGRGFFEDAITPRMPLTPGCVYYLFPDRWHCFDPDPGTVWTEYWALFDGKQAENAFGQLIPPGSPVVRHGNSPELREAFESLVSLHMKRDQFSVEYSNFLLHSILIQVFRRFNNIASTTENKLIARAKQAADQAIRDGVPFDFRQFAETERIGFETFRKDFARELGMSPNNYLISARVSRAMELLLNPFTSVKDIALSLGFRDQYYFSRLFKSRNGISPEHYRQRMHSIKSYAEIEAEKLQAIRNGYLASTEIPKPRGGAMRALKTS